MSFQWASWTGVSKCSSGPRPGTAALAAGILEAYDLAYSGGIYNCRPIRGSSSLSIHADGRAFDCMFPLVNRRANPRGTDLLNQLGPNGRKLGIQAVIWNRRIYSATSPNGRPYTGVHPHYDHLHIENTPTAASHLTLSTVRSILAPSTQEDELMLSIGDEGRAVEAFEEEWNQMADRISRFRHITVDGKYTQALAGLVKEFQAWAGLKPPTGKVDGLTAWYVHRLDDPHRG